MLSNALATQSCLGLLGALLDRQAGVQGGCVGGGWAPGAGKLSSKEPEGYGGKEDVSSRAATPEDSCQSACCLRCPAPPQVCSVPTHVG